ncbi:MAG: hypothetical protein J4F40_10630, partial [Alphaproteobacteria bacterium]|nr:hypothetical protein [Alphaproteobacteria bacterium]
IPDLLSGEPASEHTAQEIAQHVMAGHELSTADRCTVKLIGKRLHPALGYLGPDRFEEEQLCRLVKAVA